LTELEKCIDLFFRYYYTRRIIVREISDKTRVVYVNPDTSLLQENGWDGFNMC
jgi:hypothetical protein